MERIQRMEHFRFFKSCCIFTPMNIHIHSIREKVLSTATRLKCPPIIVVSEIFGGDSQRVDGPSPQRQRRVIPQPRATPWVSAPRVSAACRAAIKILKTRPRRQTRAHPFPAILNPPSSILSPAKTPPIPPYTRAKHPLNTPLICTLLPPKGALNTLKPAKTPLNPLKPP